VNQTGLAIEYDGGWQAAIHGLALRKYDKELDTVIKLNLQRILEQHKAGVAGRSALSFTPCSVSTINIWFIIGYKQREKINEALRAGTPPLNNTLERYNRAAEMLDPPRPALTYTSMVDGGFYAVFDRLQMGVRHSVSTEPWMRNDVWDGDSLLAQNGTFAGGTDADSGRGMTCAGLDQIPE
jgi:hypothetical protein